MVIIPTIVKTDQFILEQSFYLFGLGIEHPDDFILGSLVLPANQKKVGENFYIIKYNAIVGVFSGRSQLGLLLFRLELHLSNSLETMIRLVAAAHGKGQDLRLHVTDVIANSGSVGIIQDLLDEVYGRGCITVNFFIEVAGHKIANSLLALDDLCIYHLLSFQGKSTIDVSYWQIVAVTKHSPKRCVPGKDFNLDTG